MPELSVGTLFGPYKLEAEIGRGGMARVFRARQPSLDRIVALKVLAPDLARDAVFVARFQQEALIAAALEHPNIVPIYDVGESNGQPYLTMRYVPGRSLADALRQDGPFSVARGGRILEQIAHALDYAHSRGVVHRDLKPANILVQANDFASLVDFGIARAGDGTRLTRIGQIAGTPAYMSPEQIQGLPGDYRSDLYALGILGFELFSGRVPYNADSDVAMLHQHVYEPPPSIRSLQADLPRSAELAIERMIAKRPEDRFSSGAAFVAALTNPSLAEPARRGVPGSRRGVWIPAAAAVAAVALSALALLMLRSPSEVSVAGVVVTPVGGVPTLAVVAAALAAPTAAPPPAPTAPVVPQAAAAVPAVDPKAECAQRMAGVDAVWDTDLSVAIARLQDVVNWDASCGDAKNKLYAARVNHARELLHDDRSNDALALLRQAIQDNPGGGEAVVLERATSNYVAGQQAASNADWPKVIDSLNQVHAEDAGFADGKAEDLLFRARVNYGNSFSAAQQWAQAHEQYAAALALRPDDGPTQDVLASTDQHLQLASVPLVPPVAAVAQPDVQTQQDVMAAIQRANGAWTNARASLNTADLAAGVAGQELQDDIGVINSLRQQNHYVLSHELSFAATRLSAAGPNRAVVDTRESWDGDVFDLSTRRLVKHDPATSYSETYTVDRINGRWIVTSIVVH